MSSCAHSLSFGRISGAFWAHQDDMVTCTSLTSGECEVPQGSWSQRSAIAPRGRGFSWPLHPRGFPGAVWAWGVTQASPPCHQSGAGDIPPDLVRKEWIEPALSPAIAAGHREALLVLRPCWVAACPHAPSPVAWLHRDSPAQGDHLRTPNTNKWGVLTALKWGVLTVLTAGREIWAKDTVLKPRRLWRFQSMKSRPNP